MDEYTKKNVKKYKPFSSIVKKDVAIQAITNDIIAGLSKGKIIEKYMKLWGGSNRHIQQYIDEAINQIATLDNKEQIRAINAARLLQVYSECYEKGDKKTALKAIDIMNKTLNLYSPDQTNIQINNGADNTTFTLSFGNGIKTDLNNDGTESEQDD